MTGLGATFAGLVTDGSLVIGILVAALAGVVSFASPCVLPLIPGYLGYVTGLAGGAAAARTPPAGSAPSAPTEQPPPSRQSRPSRQRQPVGDRSATQAVEEPPATTVLPGTPPVRGSGAGDSVHALVAGEPGGARVLLGASLFVLGFTVVFVSFGALFGGLGRVLLEWAPLLTRIMGVVTIVMGLAFMGVVPWLQRERRIHALPRAGLAGAPVLGVVFGLGWTPCLGPTLAAVSTLAYSQASATRGAVLGLAYCLGLGLPFLAVAMGLKQAMGMSAWARAHARTVMRTGGILLVALGLLLVTGAWDQIMIWMRAWLATTGLGTSSI